jgi:uncharacterized membrane protein
MSKNKIVFILGIALVILPFLGFPSAWKTFLMIIIGLFLISLSFTTSLRKRTSGKKYPRTKKDIPGGQISKGDAVSVVSSSKKIEEVVVEEKENASTPAQDDNNTVE